MEPEYTNENRLTHQISSEISSLLNDIKDIEAFTVIEEAVGDLGQAERAQLVQKIKSNLIEMDEKKKLLVSELVKVITNY